MTATSSAVPIVLPVVEVNIDEHDRLRVSLDKEPYEVPGNVIPSGRAALGRVLAEITTSLDSPIRVTIREADGSLFTDILTPPSQVPTPEQRSVSALHSVAGATRVGLVMDGFTSGEPVAVAVVVMETLADASGGVELRLPATLLSKHPGQLVLLGRTSGAVAFSDDRHLAGTTAGSVA